MMPMKLDRLKPLTIDERAFKVADIVSISTSV